MAGLIDGDGCIDMQFARYKNFNNQFYCRPRLRIVLSGIPGEIMIPQFLANFGGGKDGKRIFENPNWKEPHSWCLIGKTELRKFLQNIVNHLVIKKEQAKFAIWYLDKLSGRQVTESVKRLVCDEFKAMKVDPHRLSERAAASIEKALETEAIVG
jgi:hypothetical protein